MRYGHWEYQGVINDLDYIGFTYRVDFENGLYYFGSKKMWHKVLTSPVDSTSKPFDWKTYTTSSTIVNKMLNDGRRATFTILELYTDYVSLQQAEQKLLREHNVLYNDMCLNATDKISASVSKLWADPEYRKKQIAAQNKGRRPMTAQELQEAKKRGSALWEDTQYREMMLRKRRDQRVISITIDGTAYKSYTEVEHTLGLSYEEVKAMIKKKTASAVYKTW